MIKLQYERKGNTILNARFFNAYLQQVSTYILRGGLKVYGKRVRIRTYFGSQEPVLLRWMQFFAYYSR